MPPSEPIAALAVVDGRYEIVGEAGRGGAGTAFLARDRARGGAAVALKVLRGVGADRRALLEAEVRALARIAHPAIPQVRDLGVVRTVDGAPPDPALRPGALFLARDFVEGTDLFQATRGKPWPEVRPLAVALAAALGAVHARGLAHGDVKPGNVLVPARPGPGEPPVRLIDFGTGATVEYLAPERNPRGAALAARGDLYALGATLYRVLSGEVPHPGRTAGEVARAALEETPVPLGRHAPTVPAEVEAAVMRLLERTPARRFASAEAFLRAIGEPAAPAEERAVSVSLEAAPLVGRDAERALLAGAVEMAPGRPRVVLVEGGWGLGKSRLLREAALEARLRGLRVAAASGRAGAPPFALFLEALPELGPVAAPPAESGGLESRAPAVLRALDALAGRILALAAARPIALVLDDIDRAGAEDRALAALLARRLGGARPAGPVVLIASARPPAAGAASVALEGARIALRDLPRETLPALVRGALGPVVRGEDALLDELARRAGGNPALAAAALADLGRTGALAMGAGGARFSAEAGLEVGASTAVPRCGDFLPKEERARALALALAVLARPVPIGLAAAAAGLDLADAREGFGLLAEADLALETDGRLALAPGAPAATDPAFSSEARRETCRRAAEALDRALSREGGAAEGGSSSPAGADAAERGRLLLEAGAPPAEAGAALLEAGRRALAALAFEKARALLERALPLVAAERRRDALAALGEAALAAGAAPDAAARLAEAVALPPKDARTLLLLAEAEAARGNFDAALARIEEARGAAAGPDERARAGFLEGRFRLGRGDLAGAETALRRALDAAPAPEIRAAALGELAGVHFRRAEPAAAAELLVEAGRLERACGNTRGRGLCHLRLGHALEALGDRAGARRHHQRALRLYRRAADRAGLSNAWACLATVARNDGDPLRSERLFRRAIRLKRELGIVANRAMDLANLGVARIALGRYEAALRALAAGCALARASGERSAWLTGATARAEALAALGRTREALRIYRAIRRHERERPHAYGSAHSDWALGHILLARGEHARAAQRFRRAERGMAKAGHPIDLAHVHAVLLETYRRVAGLEPRPLADGGAALRGARAGASGAGGAGAAEAVAALEAERRRAARLLGAAAALAAEADPARLLERLCEEAVQALAAERAFVVLRSEAGGLEFAASRNFEREAVLRAESKAPHALIERVIAEGRAIASADALRDPRLGELTSVQMLDVRSVLAVPIREPGGAILGALYADHRLKPGGFGTEGAAVAEALAAMAGAAVARGRAVRAVRAREDEVATLRALLEAGETGERSSTSTSTSTSAGAGAGAEGGLRDAFAAIIGRSRPMRAVIEAATRVAATELPVLVLGESGTGKELLARAIHVASGRRARAFVAESCAAIHESLLESELFGHVRGAFTGADRDRAGLFEQASGGTLFLDEVGEMGPELQAKLLRALQEGEVRPVGAAAPRRVDVRVVAATNRDLEALRREGRFRDDLYFRLAAVTIRIPPLRDRPEDLAALAERILLDVARRAGRKRLLLEPEAADRLRAHGWPGNVRELEHVLRAASLFADRGRIGIAALRAAGLGAAARAGAAAGLSDEPLPPTYRELRAALDDRERAFVRAALEAAGGNRARAAAALGLSRYAFRRLLVRLGIEDGAES